MAFPLSVFDERQITGLDPGWDTEVRFSQPATNSAAKSDGPRGIKEGIGTGVRGRRVRDSREKVGCGRSKAVWRGPWTSSPSRRRRTQKEGKGSLARRAGGNQKGWRARTGFEPATSHWRLYFSLLLTPGKVDGGQSFEGRPAVKESEAVVQPDPKCSDGLLIACKLCTTLRI